jgi:protein-tyrosine phosphatase
VLVHCEQGYHRTGVLVAAYRVAVCNWSVERALAEMEECGFELHRPKRQALVAGWLKWAEARWGVSKPE